MLDVGRLRRLIRVLLTKAIATLAVLCIFAGTVGLARVEAAEPHFSLEGYYFPIGKSRLIPDLRHIELVRFWHHDSLGPISVRVQLGLRTKYPLRHDWRRYSLARLQFATHAVRGVHYTFDGRFSVSQEDRNRGNFADSDGDKPRPVLHGVLSKFVRGKLIGSERVAFSYFAGD